MNAGARTSRLKTFPFLNVFLFAATLFTTFLAGLSYGPGPDEVTIMSLVKKGAVYSLPLIAILLSHEMGHYITGRKNGVRVSLPYFIPVPAFEGILNIGTMGAVIRMRSRIPSPSALLEIGAAGPLAGLVVALPLLAWGLSLSPVMELPPGVMRISEGNSLLYLGVKYLVAGPVPPGHDVILHPVAWASWIGLLVTMLNLFPAGQLDGGHIVYALFPRQHAMVSIIAQLVCLALFVLVGAYFALRAFSAGMGDEVIIAESLSGMNWLVWAFIILIVRRAGKGASHPPVGPGRLSRRHRVLGITTLVIFVLIFMPVPLHIYYF